MIFKAILMGIIQGFTLILPVSHSGHLALLKEFFTVDSTLLSVSESLFVFFAVIGICIYCRKELAAAGQGVFTLIPKFSDGTYKQGLNYGEKLLITLLLGTIPLVPLIFLMDRVQFISTRTGLVAILFIINGIILLVCDRMPEGTDTLETSDYQKPFFVGLFQVFGSALPGIARTGSVITGGVFFGYSKKTSVKFAVLLSVPSLIGYGIINFNKSDFLSITLPGWIAIIAGCFAAALAAYTAVILIISASQKSRLGIFSIYCFIIGLTLIILSALK